MFADHDGMFFGGGFMWIFWLLLIVFLVFIIKAVAGGKSGSKNSMADSPLEIIKKRYARGEIDEEEYKRLRKELER